VYKKVPLRAAGSDPQGADQTRPVGCEPFCTDRVEKAKALLNVGWFPNEIFVQAGFSGVAGKCPHGKCQFNGKEPVKMTWTAGSLQERQIFGLAATALLRATGNEVVEYVCKNTERGWQHSNSKLATQFLSIS